MSFAPTVHPKEESDMPGNLIERCSGRFRAGDGVGGAGPHGIWIGRFAQFAPQGRGPALPGWDKTGLVAVISIGEWS
jgi:hypothetical protein